MQAHNLDAVDVMESYRSKLSEEANRLFNPTMNTRRAPPSALTINIPSVGRSILGTVVEEKRGVDGNDLSPDSNQGFCKLEIASSANSADAIPFATRSHACSIGSVEGGWILAGRQRSSSIKREAVGIPAILKDFHEVFSLPFPPR
jgi:hypothetical protein